MSADRWLERDKRHEVAAESLAAAVRWLDASAHHLERMGLQSAADTARRQATAVRELLDGLPKPPKQTAQNRWLT